MNKYYNVIHYKIYLGPSNVISSFLFKYFCSKNTFYLNAFI